MSTFGVHNIDAKGSNKVRRLIVVFLVSCMLIIAVCAFCIPIDWEAGACSGGYATHIFNKYEDILLQKYLSGMEDEVAFQSLDAVTGSQTAEWDERTIQLSFDIEYTKRNGDSGREKVTFIGKRIWFETFRWSGAIISG